MAKHKQLETFRVVQFRIDAQQIASEIIKQYVEKKKTYTKVVWITPINESGSSKNNKREENSTNQDNSPYYLEYRQDLLLKTAKMKQT